jgi:hypothetical protein
MYSAARQNIEKTVIFVLLQFQIRKLNFLEGLPFVSS